MCLTLCDPVDCNPPGSSVHGILQARILEWVAREYIFKKNLYFVLGYSRLTNNIVIVSGEQQRDSAIHIHVFIRPPSPPPIQTAHDIEQSSMCYTVGPCWLSILDTTVCTCQSKLLNYFPPVLPPGNHRFI